MNTFCIFFLGPDSPIDSAKYLAIGGGFNFSSQSQLETLPCRHPSSAKWPHVENLDLEVHLTN